MIAILLFACGNSVQRSDCDKSEDSAVFMVDSVNDWTEPKTTNEDVDEYSDNSYTTQSSDIVKVFDVVADVYKVNTTTMEMSFRGKEDLQVTLYSNHTAML